MMLSVPQRVGMVVLSMAAPRRLAQIMLRPYPQRMDEELQTSGHAERIEFDTAGGIRCRGWWVTPAGGGVPDRVVVLAHGWTSHALRLANYLEPLLGLGFQVMLYNARSHGDSDHYPVCSLAQFTEDVMAATRYAYSRVPHVGVIGHSLGAAATVVAAADGAPIEAAAVLAAPAHPRDASADILRTERVPAELIMRRIEGHVERFIGRPFAELAVERRIREVTCPLLVVHGTADEVVPYAHFERIRRAAGEKVETLSVPGVDHDAVKTAPLAEERVKAFLVSNLLKA